MGKRKNDIRKAKAKAARKGSVKVSHNVAVGKWTDVRKGQVIAEGTYTDGQGVLRDAQDGSVVSWHCSPRIREEFGLTGHCTRRGLTPADLVHDPKTGAPWCPECWPTEQKRRQRENLKKEFEDLAKAFSSIPLIGDAFAKSLKGFLQGDRQ